MAHFLDLLGEALERGALSDVSGVPTSEHRYRSALFHLMCSQTSCYRYWGEGLWTDYGRELCRRAREALLHDF